MKKLKLLLLTITLVLLPIISFAQDSNDIQAYWIHEDRVKPNMTDEYEQISKDLVTACKEHNVQATRWLTMALNDNSYLYITPIKNFAEMDVDVFAKLSEKMGKDKMNDLFARYNPTYDEHGDYMVFLHKKLSYMPGGISQTIEGQNYRTLYYNYVTPENDANYVAVLKKMKAAFEKNNSKMHYRVYKTGFGVMGTYYMIAVAAENNLANAKMGDDNWNLMKDDFDPLLKEMSKYTWKMNEKRGWMREDLGYIPAK